ncbi:MAG: hypothetical protein IPJ13_11455 [Saprospiraceae bacterium]|nr:hypothetical protein [Saprospiraceae bacterium]
MNVKISHVNNLTDARYFAAAGVRFLGFCCNPGASQYCSVSRISEICQWIEGPEFVLEFDGWQSEQEIETILSSVTVQAVHFGAFSTYQSSFGIPVFKDFIFENIADADFTQVDFPVIRSVKEFSGFLDTDLDIINHKMGGKAFYLDIPFEVSDLDRLISTFPNAGLVLRGGAEEKTGFKSFEQIDSIFDALELVE